VADRDGVQLYLKDSTFTIYPGFLQDFFELLVHEYDGFCLEGVCINVICDIALRRASCVVSLACISRYFIVDNIMKKAIWIYDHTISVKSRVIREVYLWDH
jgi:hypothetical protein